MALNNLNNPYSPQPSTPLATPEDNGGGVPCILPSLEPQHHVQQQQPIIHQTSAPAQQQMNQLQQFQQQLEQQRSRHSSAESEPPLRNLLLSPPVAAGDVPMSAVTAGASVGNNGLNDSYGSRTRHASAGQAGQWPMLGDKPQPTSLFQEFSSGAMGTESFETAKKSSSDMPDDLDMALSALKDCDREFSKFVEETGEPASK